MSTTSTSPSVPTGAIRESLPGTASSARVWTATGAAARLSRQSQSRRRRHPRRRHHHHRHHPRLRRRLSRRRRQAQHRNHRHRLRCYLPRHRPRCRRQHPLSCRRRHLCLCRSPRGCRCHGRFSPPLLAAASRSLPPSYASGPAFARRRGDGGFCREGSRSSSLAGRGPPGLQEAHATAWPTELSLGRHLTTRASRSAARWAMILAPSFTRAPARLSARP